MADSISNPPYQDELDGIRGIAISMVVLGHYLPSLSHYLPSATLGVRIFFVLSGFLITRILLTSRGDASLRQHPPNFLALKHFYFRRMLRIFPVYYLAICGAILLGEAQAPYVATALLTFTTNWWMIIHSAGIGTASPYWSIAVEEQFYIVWPLVILYSSYHHILRNALILCAVGCLTRFIGSAFGMSSMAMNISTFSVLDALGLGAVLAILVWQQRYPLLQQARVWAGCLGVPLCILDYGFSASSFEYPLAIEAAKYSAYAVFGFWLVAHAHLAIPGLIQRILKSGVLVSLGRLSYGIYAYHMLFYGLASILLKAAGLPIDAFKGFRQLVLLLAVYGFASLSWRYFEAPILRLKKHFPADSTSGSNVNA